MVLAARSLVVVSVKTSMKAMPNNQRLFWETNSIDNVQPSSIDCYYDLILFRYDEFIRSDRLLAATRWQSDEQITHQSLSHCGLLFLVSLHCPLSSIRGSTNNDTVRRRWVSLSLSFINSESPSLQAQPTMVERMEVIHSWNEAIRHPINRRRPSRSAISANKLHHHRHRQLIIRVGSRSCWHTGRSPSARVDRWRWRRRRWRRRLSECQPVK